ncbi:DoxX family protein [Thioclava sp. BHET1]|uniref:DoxX family protein n=1 Tax=Thioclava dalianensis TaxID=1185766 RepID=UPI00068B7854|nr:DoxX family protein [Thioclava dalianensis]TMV92678.1 DoxX family protein [Thioclava sp. BHET1]SFN11727.1 putative oxidoreductase [Thioclava dalianensis]
MHPKLTDSLNLAGRILIALLFFGGAAQKVTDPQIVEQMIGWLGLPGWLVWPVALFNLIAALALIFGPRVQLWAVLLAGYCIFTSWFHWQLRADPWQVTIVVKNWAIAGGLLILAAQGPGRFKLWR